MMCDGFCAPNSPPREPHAFLCYHGMLRAIWLQRADMWLGFVPPPGRGKHDIYLVHLGAKSPPYKSLGGETLEFAVRRIGSLCDLLTSVHGVPTDCCPDPLVGTRAF